MQRIYRACHALIIGGRDEFPDKQLGMNREKSNDTQEVWKCKSSSRTDISLAYKNENC